MYFHLAAAQQFPNTHYVLDKTSQQTRRQFPRDHQSSRALRVLRAAGLPCRAGAPAPTTLSIQTLESNDEGVAFLDPVLAKPRCYTSRVTSTPWQWRRPADQTRR